VAEGIKRKHRDNQGKSQERLGFTYSLSLPTILIAASPSNKAAARRKNRAVNRGDQASSSRASATTPPAAGFLPFLNSFHCFVGGVVALNSIQFRSFRKAGLSQIRSPDCRETNKSRRFMLLGSEDSSRNR
jgi:hypothetical protein